MPKSLLPNLFSSKAQFKGIPSGRVPSLRPIRPHVRNQYANKLHSLKYEHNSQIKVTCAPCTSALATLLMLGMRRILMAQFKDVALANAWYDWLSASATAVLSAFVGMPQRVFSTLNSIQHAKGKCFNLTMWCLRGVGYATKYSIPFWIAPRSCVWFSGLSLNCASAVGGDRWPLVNSFIQ